MVIMTTKNRLVILLAALFNRPKFSRYHSWLDWFAERVQRRTFRSLVLRDCFALVCCLLIVV